MCSYKILTFFSGLDAAKKEIGALKAAVTTMIKEKREHVQSKHIELFIVWF